jgi:two-component system, cell cycle response regulator DivK
MAVILLVDDNDDQREIYRKVLEHRGHACHTAPDGRLGIAMAQELAPNIIILDIGMPGMSGWGVIALLKASPATASIPIIAVTAHALPEDEAHAQTAGFDGYLRKPIEPMEVVVVVERLLRS